MIDISLVDMEVAVVMLLNAILFTEKNIYIYVYVDNTPAITRDRYQQEDFVSYL